MDIRIERRSIQGGYFDLELEVLDKPPAGMSVKGGMCGAVL